MNDPAGLEPSGKAILTKQQEGEWRAFQSFLNDYPLPSGAVEHSDKPDVLIHGERMLGIELTSLYMMSQQHRLGWRNETRQLSPSSPLESDDCQHQVTTTAAEGNVFIHRRGKTNDAGEDLFPCSFIRSLAAPSNYVGPIFGSALLPEGSSSRPTTAR
ncbi:hypothetical protein [Burkholderia cepacia]|uniref:hypothetical protein n=1 Tax=Burkholderia cepacia TaxID=292 RepID=UPI0012D87AF4|nr:hypothetical protein [Burkholderia cepacia]